MSDIDEGVSDDFIVSRILSIFDAKRSDYKIAELQIDKYYLHINEESLYGELKKVSDDDKKILDDILSNFFMLSLHLIE